MEEGINDKEDDNETMMYFNSTCELIKFVESHRTPVDLSIEFQVIIYILYNSVFITAVIGNFLVCYVIWRNQRMKTVTNYLIANLAIGDLLTAMLCVPFSYISVLYQRWQFGPFLCHLLGPSQAICVFVSAYTLIALAADRYIAILFPLKPRLRKKQALLIIGLVWCIAFITAIPIISTQTYVNCEDNMTKITRCEEQWDDDNQRVAYSLVLMVLQYFFPLAVLVFTYGRIVYAVWGKQAEKPGEIITSPDTRRDARLAKAKRKMIKMILWIVILWNLSWLPFNLVMVIRDLDEDFENWKYFPFLFSFVQFFAQAHTVFNPAIYCLLNKHFRMGFRAVFQNMPCCIAIRCLKRKRKVPDLLIDRENTIYTYRSQRGHQRNSYENSRGGAKNKLEAKHNNDNNNKLNGKEKPNQQSNYSSTSASSSKDLSTRGNRKEISPRETIVIYKDFEMIETSILELDSKKNKCETFIKSRQVKRNKENGNHSHNHKRRNNSKNNNMESNC